MPQNFNVTPLGGFNIGDKLEKVSGTLRARGRQSDLSAALTRVASEGSPQEIANFMAQYPEAAGVAEKLSEFKSNSTKQSLIDSANRTLYDGADPVTEMENHIGVIESEGGDTAASVAALGEALNDPNAAKTRALKILALYDKPAFDSLRSMSSGGNKLTEKAKNYEYAKGQGFTGSFLEFQNALSDKDRTTAIKEFEYAEKNPRFALKQKQAADDKAAKASAGKNFKDVMDLRKEFLTQSKDYQKVRDAYMRVKASTHDPSPAGDLSLIFNYMKMLDPGSVVRESEFRTAAAAGSYGERIKAAANKVISGERLSPAMREDFVKKSGELSAGMERQHTKRVTNYSRLARRNDFPVDEVVVDITEATEEVIGLPEGVTEEQMTFTMDKYKLTRQQVLDKLGSK